MHAEKDDNRNVNVPNVDDKPSIAKNPMANLRTTAQDEVNLLIKAHNGTVKEVQELLAALGKTLLSDSMKAMFLRMGLAGDATLEDLVRACNSHQMLYQPNKLITMTGLQIIAAYINKMPLIEDAKGNVSFWCLCGKQHTTRKVHGHKNIKCDKLNVYVKAVSNPRLSLEFYSKQLDELLRLINEVPNIPVSPETEKDK